MEKGKNYLGEYNFPLVDFLFTVGTFREILQKTCQVLILPLRWDADAEAMWQQQGPPVLPVLLLHAPIRAVLCRWEILKHPPRTLRAKLRAWRFEWSGDLVLLNLKIETKNVKIGCRKNSWFIGSSSFFLNKLQLRGYPPFFLAK